MVKLRAAIDKLRGKEVVSALGPNSVPRYYGPLGKVLADIKASYLEHGKAEIGVPVVHVWLARSEGASSDPVFILQRRSDNHKLDKTVGGHISNRHRYSPDRAALQELREEMGGVRVRIAPGVGERALAGSGTHLDGKDAVISSTGQPQWVVSGRFDRGGVYYEKPTELHTYTGFYDGPLDTIKHDREVEGFVAMPYSEIVRQLAESPDTFTPDIKDLVHGVAAQFMNPSASQPAN